MTQFMLGLVTLLPLGLAALVFFYYTVEQRSTHGIFTNFNFLMSIFMGGWFVTELLELLALPPIQEEAQYFHFIIMAVFAVVMTWRWRWAEKLSHKSPF